jgi:molybdopterin-guanine dinucleotide biosynthesis protein A
VPAGVDVTADGATGVGPLGGIAAGLARLRDRHGFDDRDAAFVTGCDLPFVTAATVRWLAERLGDDDVLMPRAAAVLQPLLAVYRIAVLDHARRLLAAGERSLHALAVHGAVLDEERLRQHDPELSCLRDVDDPASYDAAVRALAEGRPR